MNRRLLLLGMLALLMLSCRAVTRVFEPAPPTPPTTTPLPYLTPLPTITPIIPTATPLEPTRVPPTPPDPAGLISAPQVAPASFAHPDRPDLGATVYYVDTPHFRLHYTLASDHAVPTIDADTSGIPDYVEETAIAFEYSWQVEVDVLGWAAPPADNGIAGGDLYDVYFEDIYDDGTAGYTDGGYDDTLVGDNPNSPATELYASYSYISIDNDFAENDEWGDPSIPLLDVMRATAAHEFNHALQFGYDGFEPAAWLWEATATWMEDLVYDDINDSDFYLETVYKSPDTCQIAEGEYDTIEDGHWYGMWIFLRFISERHGNGVILSLWEHLATQDDYAALEATLSEQGLTLDKVFTDFAIALLLRDFEEGLQHPVAALEGEVSLGEAYTPVDGVPQMAVDFVRVLPSGLTTITLSGLRDGVLVGIRAQQADIHPLINGRAAIDGHAYDVVYLLVLNLVRAASESDCTAADYTITLSSASEAGVPAQVIPAPNFRAPRIESDSLLG